jgi:hypothetical protein
VRLAVSPPTPFISVCENTGGGIDAVFLAICGYLLLYSPQNYTVKIINFRGVSVFCLEMGKT